jgi:hypothetical protein
MKAHSQTGSERITLLPQIESHHQLPVNFNEGDRELFADALSKVIPPVNLLTLSNVGISPDGFLFRGGKILAESFAFPFMKREWKHRSVLKFFVTNYLLRKAQPVKDEALWIVDSWSTGYFHWLTDALSRLFVMGNDLGGRVLFLPHDYERLEFVRVSLEAFAVDSLKFIEADATLRCEQLILPTPVAPSGYYRDEIIQGVRDKLSGHFAAGTSSTAKDRIYISRARAPKRKIANEAEVVATLRKFHFEIVHAEDLSFADQVRLAAGSRYLISNHGAGLTNMLFMGAGSSVLELRHELDRVNNCYFTLSSALDHNYFYQTCAGENDLEDPHTANLVVDIDRLSETVKLMLEDSSSRRS